MSGLCQSCGLCCDGSLFGRVDLRPEELDRARRALKVIASGKSFEQPCAALDERRRCSIYDERPHACQRFTCRLYEGDLPLVQRLAIVRRTRALLDEAKTTRVATDELARLLEEHFARA